MAVETVEARMLLCPTVKIAIMYNISTRDGVVKLIKTNDRGKELGESFLLTRRLFEELMEVFEAFRSGVVFDLYNNTSAWKFFKRTRKARRQPMFCLANLSTRLEIPWMSIVSLRENQNAIRNELNEAGKLIEAALASDIQTTYSGKRYLIVTKKSTNEIILFV